MSQMVIIPKKMENWYVPDYNTGLYTKNANELEL